MFSIPQNLRSGDTTIGHRRFSKSRFRAVIQGRVRAMIWISGSSWWQGLSSRSLTHRNGRQNDLQSPYLSGVESCAHGQSVCKTALPYGSAHRVGATLPLIRPAPFVASRPEATSGLVFQRRRILRAPPVTPPRGGPPRSSSPHRYRRYSHCRSDRNGQRHPRPGCRRHRSAASASSRCHCRRWTG